MRRRPGFDDTPKRTVAGMRRLREPPYEMAAASEIRRMSREDLRMDREGENDHSDICGDNHAVLRIYRPLWNQ